MGSKLSVNHRFASDYESKKRRQELSRAQEQGLLDSESDSESDEDEDSDAEMLTEDVDLKVLETIKKIRSKDPEIYDSSKSFFTDADTDVERVREGKRMSYKDVVREQTLEDMEMEDAGRGGSGGEVEEERKRFAYDDEQEELRRAFIDNADVDEDEEGDGMLRKRVKNGNEEERERRMEEEFEAMEKAKEGRESLSPFRDPRGEIEDTDKFLREFTVKRKWKEEDKFKCLGEEEVRELEVRLWERSKGWSGSDSNTSYVHNH